MRQKATFHSNLLTAEWIKIILEKQGGKEKAGRKKVGGPPVVEGGFSICEAQSHLHPLTNNLW